MSHDADEWSYSRSRIELLLDGGTYEYRVGNDGRGSYVPDAIDEMDPRLTWAGLRSSIEAAGRPDWEGALIVMDLERALHMMSRRHPDAATVVATRILNDLSDDEMDEAMPAKRGRPNWRRLRAKAAAWISVYLSGASIAECERAYRQAR
jgi:hypothetical protein